MNKFSIIMPVFNAESFLEESLNSVLNLNFKNYEVVVVNDGSTDNTLKILNNYSNINNIKIINLKKNSGVSTSRNIGLNIAKGEYILFLDCDDFLIPESLNILNIIIEKDKSDIVSFGFNMKNDNKTISFSNKKYNEIKFNSDDFLILFFKRKIYQCMCSFVCKATIIQENKISFTENTFYAEDQEFQLKCIGYCKTITYISEKLFIYNVRSGSAMNSNYSIRNLTGFEAFERLILFFKENKVVYKYFENYALYFYFSNIRKISKSKTSKDFKYKEYTKEMIKLKPHLQFDNKVSFYSCFLIFIDKISHKLLLTIFRFF